MKKEKIKAVSEDKIKGQILKKAAREAQEKLKNDKDKKKDK